MNTFNRVVIVILLLALMVLMTLIFILPHVILTNAGLWLSNWGEYFNQMQPWLRFGGGILLAIIFDMVLAVIVFFELRPRRKRSIRVQNVSGGMVTINDTSIIQQLTYKLDPVPGVLSVEPVIRAKRDKVQATVHVEVAAGASVPNMATKLMDIVQSVLVHDLGLQVFGQPEVRIKVAPAPGGTLPQPVPQPRPPAAKPESPSSSPPPLPEKRERETPEVAVKENGKA